MAIVLALLSALAYGISDFGAGVASRRSDAGVVSPILLAIGLVCAGVAVACWDELPSGAIESAPQPATSTAVTVTRASESATGIDRGR